MGKTKQLDLAVIFSIISLILSRPSNDRELAPASSPRNFLPTNGRILKLRGSKHIISMSLASLIVGTETPAESFAVSVDSDAMIRPSGRELSAGEIRNRERDKLSCASAAIVDSDLVFIEGRRVDAHLIVVAAAEGETRAALGNCYSVEASAGDLDDFISRAGKGGDFGRDADNIGIGPIPLDVCARLSVPI